MSQKLTYKFSDFEILSRENRVYGSGGDRMTLAFVKIKNKVTNTIFWDWVKPIQLRSTKSLNELINWDNENPEVVNKAYPECMDN